MWRADSSEKTLMLWKIEGGKRKGWDELVGLHHRLNGHQFEQTLEDSEGQRSLVCCIHSVTESDRTKLLNSKGTWGAVLRDPSKTEFILLPPSSRLSVVLHLGYHLYPHNSLLVLNLMTWCVHQPCNLPFSWLLTDALPALLPCLDSP